MNDGSATPLACTVGGIGGAATSTAGSANASRSPATDVLARDSTTPTTPLTAPAVSSPRVISDSRLPWSGSSDASDASGSAGVSVKRPEVSNRSTTTPHTVPTTVGTTSVGSSPPRDSTAAQPATPAATITALPIGNRGRSIEPATAAMTASTRIDSASLSAVPNVVIAHSFTGPGVRSMTDDPTAVRESDCGPTNAATSWVMPSDTAAAAMPAIARDPLDAMQAKVPIRPPERLTD